MSNPLTGRAADGFEAYYYRKLRSWIPELYWINDLETGSLDALIQAVADRLAQMRRDVDRVWTASSVEIADDWAIRYLGDLVGAETLSASNPRGNRTLAANFMSYHQRKTTRYLLDTLIEDIAGAEGYVREIERWLARAPHELDLAYLRRAPLSEGPVGGLPQLAGPRTEDAALPAFDEFARLPDFGPREGRTASFDYATIHFNLFPGESWRVDMATPFDFDATHRTLDPSGRAIPLYHSATFDHRDGLWPVGPEEFPLPMACARFNDARFEVTQDALDTIGSPQLTAELTHWIGVAFRTKQDFERILIAPMPAPLPANFRDELLVQCFREDSPKGRQLAWDLRLDIGPFVDTRVLDPFQIIAADLATWRDVVGLPPDAAILVDPATGQVRLAADPAPDLFHPLYHHVGSIYRVGAGTFPRESDVPLGPAFNDANTEVPFAPPAAGLQTFGDNRRYVWGWNAQRRHDVTGALRLEAADRARPYVVSRTGAAQRDFTLRGAAGQDNDLVIDGLWLGLLANAAIETNVGAGNPAPPAHARLILDGDFRSVTLRHVTLDPGGEQVRLDPALARAIPTVTLEIEGSIRLLKIDRCITGPIVETRADPSILNAGEIRISDSIVQSLDPTRPAISIELGRLHLTNTTVLGTCLAKLLFATNTLFDGRLNVTNRQQSCLRFSAVARYDDDTPSKLPRRFEGVEYAHTIPPTSFASTRFGDADYAALSTLADRGLRQGGENGTEIGVGNTRFRQTRQDDLMRVIAKFLPVGQNAQIYEAIGSET
jgi:hypothetical protein